MTGPRPEFDAASSVSPTLRAIPELNFSAFWIPQMATSFAFPPRLRMHWNAAHSAILLYRLCPSIQCWYCDVEKTVRIVKLFLPRSGRNATLVFPRL